MELSRPPIKEIIFTISFSQTVEMSSIETFIQHEEVSNQFSTPIKGFQADIQQKNENKRPKTTVHDDGYILRSKDGFILNIRRGVLSFHKINGYQNFESLSFQLEKFWLLFKSCVDIDLNASLIGVRYLNFLEKNEHEKSQDLIEIFTVNPLFSPSIDKFVRLKYFYPKNEKITINIITADAIDEQKKGIVLDIKVNKEIESKPTSSSILDDFNELREIKNEIFFGCVKHSTLNRYT